MIVYDKDDRPVIIPPERKILPLLTDDMNEPMNCVHCGRQMTFGEGYTSHHYFTKGGFGYYECGECYFDKERWS